jgi:hypothetical protein
MGHRAVEGFLALRAPKTVFAVYERASGSGSSIDGRYVIVLKDAEGKGQAVAVGGQGITGVASGCAQTPEELTAGITDFLVGPPR